jgi:hypothetical protein
MVEVYHKTWDFHPCCQPTSPQNVKRFPNADKIFAFNNEKTYETVSMIRPHGQEEERKVITTDFVGAVHQNHSPIPATDKQK